MKSALFALALAGSAVAQNLSGEPPCATACLVSAISAAGCAAGDVACQCGPSQQAIGTLVAPCLIASCSASALVQAESAGLALCSLYSKTAGVPASTSASATSTSTATSMSASASSAMTSATAMSSSLPATLLTASSKTTSATAAANTTTTTTSNMTVTTSSKTMTTGSSTVPASVMSTAGAATLGAGVLAAFVGLVAAL